MKKRARHQQGSVVFDKRNRTWHFLWRENGTRRSRLLGDIAKLPTKAAAWKAADHVRREVLSEAEIAAPRTTAIIVDELVDLYRAEKMPSRKDTRRSYEVWLCRHILPQFGPADHRPAGSHRRALA